jgi:hypothetical protein
VRRSASRRAGSRRRLTGSWRCGGPRPRGHGRPNPAAVRRATL